MFSKFQLFFEKEVIKHSWRLFVLFSLAGFLTLPFPVADEKNWIEAGQAFLQAIQQQNWAGTYVGAIAGHPGVTVMWVSAVVNLLNQSLFSIEIIHRLVFILIRSALATTTVILIKDGFSQRSLCFTIIYWLFSTYLILVNRLTWPDQLLTWLLLLGTLLWMHYLKNQTLKFLIWSGVVLGLALLTKVAGIFLLPIFIFLTLMNSTKNWHHFFDILKILTIAGIVFYFIYPSMWVDPVNTPLQRFNKSSRVELRLGGSGSQLVSFYPQRSFLVEPLIPLAVVTFFYLLLMKPKKIDQPFMLGGVGVIYLFLVILSSLSLRDFGNSANAFFTGYLRYMAPSLTFLSLFFINFAVLNLKKPIFWLLFIVLISYQFFILPYFPFANHIFSNEICDCNP